MVKSGSFGGKTHKKLNKQELPQRKLQMADPRTSDSAVISGRIGMSGRCFNCGKIGHKAREWPDPKPRVMESRSTNKRHSTYTPTKGKVSAIVLNTKMK